MKQEEWDKLGFNLTNDGHWATQKEIIEKMKETRKQERKNRAILASIILGGLCALMFVLWLFL